MIALYPEFRGVPPLAFYVSRITPSVLHRHSTTCHLNGEPLHWPTHALPPSSTQLRGHCVVGGIRCPMSTGTDLTLRARDCFFPASPMIRSRASSPRKTKTGCFNWFAAISA